MTCPLVQASVITIQIIGLILALHTERTTYKLPSLDGPPSLLFFIGKLSRRCQTCDGGLETLCLVSVSQLWPAHRCHWGGRGKGGEGRSPRHRYHHMTSLKYFWRECYSTLTLLILIQNWVSTFYLTWKTIKTNIETGGKEDCTNHVSHPSLRDITELWLKLNFSCYSLVVVDVCVW